MWLNDSEQCSLVISLSLITLFFLIDDLMFLQILNTFEACDGNSAVFKQCYCNRIAHSLPQARDYVQILWKTSLVKTSNLLQH